MITGGTDSGVMRLVGRALAAWEANVAVIGVMPWGVCLHQDQLGDVYGGHVEVLCFKAATQPIAKPDCMRAAPVRVAVPNTRLCLHSYTQLYTAIHSVHMRR